MTAFWATQWQTCFAFTKQIFFQTNHPENIKYNDFLLYGNSSVLLAVSDAFFFTPKKLNAWKELSEELAAFDEIDFVLSIDNVEELKKQGKRNLNSVETAEVPQDSTVSQFLSKSFSWNFHFTKTCFSTKRQNCSNGHLHGARSSE